MPPFLSAKPSQSIPPALRFATAFIATFPLATKIASATTTSSAFSCSPPNATARSKLPASGISSTASASTSAAQPFRHRFHFALAIDLEPCLRRLAIGCGSAWKAAFTAPSSKTLLAGKALVFTLFSLPFFAGEVMVLVFLVKFSSIFVALFLIISVFLHILFHYLLKAPTVAGLAAFSIRSTASRCFSKPWMATASIASYRPTKLPKRSKISPLRAGPRSRTSLVRKIFRRTRCRTSAIERRRLHAVLLLRFELERFYHGRIFRRIRQQLRQRYLLLFVRSRLVQRVQWRLRWRWWRRWLVAPHASRAENPTYSVFRALSPTSRFGTRALESHSRRPRSSPACFRRRS
jgi:hypothetical protein